MNIWVISTFWLYFLVILYFLVVMLLQTFVYKFLYKHMFSFLLGLYLGVELLGHMVTLCLIFWRTARLFFKVVTSFYISTSNVWRLQFLHILTSTLLLYIFFTISILVDMKWYVIFLLISISLMANDVEYLFMYLFTFRISPLEKCLFKSFGF